MYTILLVEDDTFLLDMYATKFAQSGHTVESAKSVESALEKLRSGKVFDVILLDIVMPQLTGLDLLRTIKEEKLGNPIRIVLSNQGEQSDIEKAKELGAVGYIVKAQSIPSEVVATVDAFVNESKKT